MSDIAVLSALREFYKPTDGWRVLGEVRSTTGQSDDVRYADAVALNLWPSRDRLIGFEFKVATKTKHARADLRREFTCPEKALEIGRFCSRWFLVVRTPWSKTLFSFDELPEGWGLIEIGTGIPRIIRQGEQRSAEPMTEGLMLSLLRSAIDDGRQGSADTTPTMPVTRPNLSRGSMGLGCGHVVSTLAFKKIPPRVLCESCALGLPPDHAMFEAIVRDMDQEDLDHAVELIDRERAMRSGT